MQCSMKWTILEGKLCIDYEKGEYSRDKHKSQTMVESDFRAKSDT